MSAASNSGGSPPPTHAVRINLTAEAIDMGLGVGIVEDVFQAVHSTNRNSPDTDRLGLDLPAMVAGTPTARMGRVVTIHGSPGALARVLRDSRITKALEKGQAILQGPAPLEEPVGFALRRIRRGEKTTEAGLARARRRVEARGGVWQDRPHRGEDSHARRGRTIRIGASGGVLLEIERVPMPPHGDVSTYGLVGA